MSQFITLGRVKAGQYFEINGIPFIALDQDYQPGYHMRLIDQLIVQPMPHHTIRLIDVDEVKRLVDRALGNNLLVPTICSTTLWSYQYAKSYEKKRRKR